MRNNAWVLSMALSDELDPYGGPMGHRTAFFTMSMLLFLHAVLVRVIFALPLDVSALAALVAGGGSMN